MLKTFVTISIISLVFTGCVATSVQSTQKSNLTSGMAKAKIIKGETTQNEILDVFGAPNIITKNKSNNEVWTYDKVSVEKSSTEGYGTIVIAGVQGGRSSTSSRTFTLMIEFNEEDIVKDYSYRSSAF